MALGFIKAFHIIAVICWFSGIFYLPRLFVYHAMSEDQVSKDRFKIMERKLFWGITTPSAIVTILLGFWLLYLGDWFFLSFWWMKLKLLLVAFVVAFHLCCWHFMMQFRHDNNQRSHKFYRYFNEFPVLLMIPIVIFVVVKP